MNIVLCINQHYKELAGVEDSYVIDGLIDGAMEGDIYLEGELTPTLMVAGKEDVLTPPYQHRK